MTNRESGRIAELLGQGLRQLGLAVGREQQRQLTRYAEELLRWNRRINLVARKTGTQELVEKHFLDSLTLLSVLDPALEEGAHLLDIGTGAGFPGLVLAVARPQLMVTLVEPRQKRVSFLRHIIRTLGLHNVTVQCARFEELDAALSVTHVTSRALTEPRAFLRMVQGLLSDGARAILMLSPAQEKQLGQHLPPDLRVASCFAYRLPWSGAGRVVTEVRRQNSETRKDHGQCRSV